jgi:hypothetical protein
MYVVTCEARKCNSSDARSLRSPTPTAFLLHKARRKMRNSYGSKFKTQILLSCKTALRSLEEKVDADMHRNTCTFI